MLSGHRSQWVQRALGVALAASLIAPLLGATASGQETAACPQALPTSELNDSTTGIGWTVADGRTREQFSWKYMGLLKDALGPGRDLIIVDTSGPVVERHGGIFYGMSGSPLFSGDRFVGAVAYGLSYGPSTVAGITPAEDMLRVLRYPVASDDDASSSADSARMTWRMRAKIAARKQTQPGDVGPTMRRMRVPLGISGVNDFGMDAINEVIRDERLPFIPHQASSTSGAGTAGGPLQPGDNISAVMSYGDITSAGTGTLTLACEGRFVAFGHPFFWEGETTFAAHGADTITVIEDPMWGSYELANVAERVAMIDQDRLAGIRGLFGAQPPTVPITSTVSSPDTAQSRDGQTTVTDQWPVPFIAFYHLYSNIIVTMDEWSGGSSSGTFRITGVDSDGTPWELTRTNTHASEWGIAYESSFELEMFLHALLNNPFEDVEFTGVDMDFTATGEPNEYRVTDVHVSNDGRKFVDQRRIKTSRGSTVYLRVLLSPGEDEPEVPVDLAVRIPRRQRSDAIIEISGPRGFDEELCFYRPDECETATGDKVESLEDLIEVLEARPTNNLLRAALRNGERSSVKARDEELLDRVVTGRVRVKVRISGGGSGGGRDAVAEPKTDY